MNTSDFRVDIEPIPIFLSTDYSGIILDKRLARTANPRRTEFNLKKANILDFTDSTSEIQNASRMQNPYLIKAV